MPTAKTLVWKTQTSDTEMVSYMIEQAQMPTGTATKMANDVGKTLTKACDASMSRKKKRAARPNVY